MAEKALTAVIPTAYIQGIPTRSVDDLVKAMGMSGISKSRVSRLCGEIDGRLKAFRTRPIEGDWPYLWIEATYLKARRGGRIVSVAILIAIGANTDGRHEVPGLETGTSEAEPIWTEFLRRLTRRGRRGLKLVISDAHEGIKAAVSKCSARLGNAAASTLCATCSRIAATGEPQRSTLAKSSGSAIQSIRNIRFFNRSHCFKVDQEVEEKFMKLSFFTMPIHPVGKPFSQSLAEDREAFILADKLGFAEAYCGEHTTDQAEIITSCVAFLASLAYETKNIRLGTGTVNVPNSHPARIAAEVAMLDHMLEGRLNFGISPGGLMSDAEVFGSIDKDRNAMFVEGINMVLDIWAGKAPYDLKGEFWDITTARTAMPEIGQGEIMKPYQDPHPPIIGTAVAPFSKGVSAMAARGWQPISGNFLLPKWVATHWPKYVEGCESAGIVPDYADWRVARNICVADDQETARRYARDPGSPYVLYYSQLLTKLRVGGRLNLFKEDQNMPDDDVTLDYVLDRLIIHGDPSSVADQILALREETGPFRHLIYAGHDWTDYDLGRKGMILMAEKVMPILTEATKSEPSAAAA